MSLPLHCVANDDDTAVGAGHGALHQQQVALGIGLDDFQVERGDLLVAHVAGHALALEHPSRSLALADRARRAVEQRGAVRRRKL